MAMINQLTEIEQLLQQFSQQAVEHDRRSKIPSLANRPIFDDKLFKAHSVKLSAYVAESILLLNEIRNHLAKKSPARLIQFQCEKLVDQCQAIKKALSSNQQRNTAYQQDKATRKHVAVKRQQRQGNSLTWLAGNIMSNSVELYQELSKHHGYQQTLELKINQLEQQLQRCITKDKIAMQQLILKQHKRLGQCHKAIYFIEQRIELLETGKITKKY
ncbi:MAG: primosomal replication protein [Gammaproteobacteria bacterium]|nr:primosomal replication protein [Gammaproteobacteria bacterium]